jgi:hypothetical protein
VRGIPCDYWAAFIHEEFEGNVADYTMAWYFSVEDWDIHVSLFNIYLIFLLVIMYLSYLL